MFVILALVFVTLALANAATSVAAESITIATDQTVHSLGEQVKITVSYVGGTHGDVKLSIEDVSGNKMNDWTWSHASSDPFQRSVSYTPTNAGTYTIRALHQPHHMEAPVSTTAKVAFWSARIISLDYANSFDTGKPVDIKASVAYYFTQPTQVRLELRSNSENKNIGTLTTTMNGQGTAVLTLTNLTFSAIQIQNVTAQVSYQSPTDGWISDPIGGTYSAKVTVVPEFSTAPTLIVLFSLLSVGVLQRRLFRRARQ
jgi:hypothetical protein